MTLTTRALLPAAALLLAALPLRAEMGTWGFQVGAAQPAAGAKTFLGNPTGVTLDLTQAFSLATHDTVRMRFSYATFKASSDNPDLVAIGANPATSCPASTTNEFFYFSYGAEYVRNLPARLYVLAGLGAAYVTVTRKGEFNLESQGGASLVKTNYSANNFVPYLCAGLGVQVTDSVSLEARWQATSLKAQERPLDLGGGSTGTVTVPKTNLSTLSLGLAIQF